jgi:hypothetical protein
MSDAVDPIIVVPVCSGQHSSPACGDPDCHIARLDEVVKRWTSKIVLRVEINGCLVSTIELPDGYAAMGLGVYETTIKGPDGEWGWRGFGHVRANTEDEAAAAHAKAIEFVRSSIQ